MLEQKKALVLGGGGFIGSHLVKRLKSEGFWVRAVDLKYPEHWETVADDFIKDDLRSEYVCNQAIDQNFDEIYQLAADMGGAGFIFTGENDADIMQNSAKINLNILDSCVRRNVTGRIFYSSSACMYPEHNQLDPSNPNCAEDSAYPANPDSEYGWEKLFSERLFLAYRRNKGLNTFVARYHNIFGPFGTWDGGREKAPAAVCRKIAKAKSGDSIEIWGDGKQTRSFLYIDECLEATTRLTRSNFTGPVNIGSDEMVTINQLVEYVTKISGKNISINHIPGPTGVMGRNSDNNLIFAKLNWRPTEKLITGLEKTYNWIKSQSESGK
jgi:GDP-D-mannose 3',5'-epimerase